jgi:DNA replication protein DnaC
MKSMNELVSVAVAELSSKASKPTAERECYACGKKFTVPDLNHYYQKKCPDCQEKDSIRQREDAVTQRKERWMSLCPPDYRSIDRSRIPFPDKLDAVLEWKYQPKGLLLHGGTGTGKTRCAWALLEKMVMKGFRVSVMDSMAGLKYASLYSQGAEMVEVWADKVIGMDILLLDDVFKNKLTDSFEGVIFTIIDQRIQSQRPTIVTSNDTGDTLAARMTSDRAQPLLRRLRECCQTIHF